MEKVVQRVSRPRHKRGFSLIEALIAIFVIAFVLLAMMSLVPYSFGEIQVNSTQVQAIAVAQQTLEAQRNWKLGSASQPTPTSAPIDQGNSYVADPSIQNTSGGNFTVTPDACPQTQAGTQGENQFTCTVTVAWTEENQNQSVTVQSIVTK